MSYRSDDESGDDPSVVGRFASAAPAVVWGALMVAALCGAAVTVWRAPGAQERLVAARDGDAMLRRDVARIAAERDALAGRIASLERGVGELKFAQRAGSNPEFTGAISRRAAEPAPRFGLSLGSESSPDAAKRRWDAIAAAHPQQMAQLAPLVRNESGRGVYNLVAGPFASRGEAEAACFALAEQSLACDITDYAGEPIARP